MTIPTLEEISIYMEEEKKVKIPPTFYGKYEYIREYFLSRPFTEDNTKALLSEIRNDLYYRKGDKGYLIEINEYVMIIKLIAEFNGYMKLQASQIFTSTGTKMSVTWDDMKAYYYIRNNNRSSEVYYKGKFRVIEQYFYNKSFTEQTVDNFFLYLKKSFYKEHGKQIAPSYYNKFLAMIRVIGDMLNVDFMKNYKGMYEVNKETESLTADEMNKLISIDLNYDRDFVNINHRWKTLIKTLLITCARPSELQNVTWYDLKGNYLYFNETKNGSPHKVYIPDRLLIEMNKLKKYDHNYIFGSVRGQFDKESLNNEIKERCKRAGITKNITARSMRKTGITSYLEDNSIHKVAKISNHKSIDVLYSHYYKPEEDEIENIVRHNDISPEEYNHEELLRQYKKVTGKFKNTNFEKLTQKIEQTIERMIYS